MENIKVWVVLLVSLVLIFERRKLAKHIRKYEYYRWGKKINVQFEEIILMVVGLLGVLGVLVYLALVELKYSGLP